MVGATMIAAEFARLIQRCKGSVTLLANDHRSNYQTAQAYLDQVVEDGKPRWESSGATVEQREQMIEQDLVLELHFYPLTPVGFCSLIGAEIVPMLEEAHRLLTKEKVP